jgi:hypothetical protein
MKRLLWLLSSAGVFCLVLTLSGSMGATSMKRVSAEEDGQVVGGATCYDWVIEDCTRPGVVGCIHYSCWRWTQENTQGDYVVNTQYCNPTPNHGCDAIATALNGCIYQ